MAYLKHGYSLLFVVCICIASCNEKDESSIIDDPIEKYLNLPKNNFEYAATNWPVHILNALNLTDNTPSNNAITNAGATLGRVLFYDKNLSVNKTVSCASCHSQQASFADDAILSKGFAGGLTGRHSMPLLNIRFYASGKMFWDERSPTLEQQVLQPIQNEVEMGLSLQELTERVQTQPYYGPLFENAFGTTEIDTILISKALAQFVRSIVTFNSRYDRVKSGLDVFSPDEAQGERLFINPPPNGGISCAGCHTPPMFVTSNPQGPFALQDPNDAGINNERRFKSSSLRNISLRKSLFHNGSVNNLDQMLNRPPGSGQNPIPAHTVAPQNVQAFIAFINTLSDNDVIVNEKYADPFK